MTAATDWSDREIERVQQDVAQQKKLVRRMIVRGAPTQAAEDALRHKSKAAVMALHEGSRSSRIATGAIGCRPMLGRSSIVTASSSWTRVREHTSWKLAGLCTPLCGGKSSFGSSANRTSGRNCERWAWARAM